MTNSVTFFSSVGGDNSTVTDDASPTTGLANGGHRLRFVPALSQEVAVAAFVVAQAQAAAASAASAANAPGTNATTTSSVTVGTGTKTFTIQSGKAYALGQLVHLASAGNVANFIEGPVTAYNSGTGVMSINSQTTGGSGTYTDGVLSLAATAGVVATRTLNVSGLITGGGNLSADRTFTVTEALASDIRTGTDKTKVLTTGDVTDALAVVGLQYGANITTSGDANLDMSKFINGSVTATGNFILPNPINHNVGDSGRIEITQDATGSRLMTSWGSSYRAEGGRPTLSTTPGTTDYLYYDVVSSIRIVCSLVRGPTN